MSNPIGLRICNYLCRGLPLRHLKNSRTESKIDGVLIAESTFFFRIEELNACYLLGISKPACNKWQTSG